MVSTLLGTSCCSRLSQNYLTSFMRQPHASLTLPLRCAHVHPKPPTGQQGPSPELPAGWWPPATSSVCACR